MARVTVGLPTFRNADTLAASLDLILNQTIKDLDIIVSDNCSPDATWEICRAYAAQDKESKFFARAKSLLHEFPLCFGQGVVTLFRLARWR